MNMKTLMTTVFVALSATMVNAELMLTEWGAKVTSENALREYPRPQMERKNWTCLNGDWDYAITPEKIGVCTAFDLVRAVVV